MSLAVYDKSGVALLSSGHKSHFSQAEYACRCGCGENRIDQSLIDADDKFRVALQVPVYISRGVSCFKHNIKEGGAKGSKHLPICLASDKNIFDFDDEFLFTNAVNYYNAVGLYLRPHNIHSDMRETNLYWFRKVIQDADGKWKSGKYEYFNTPEVCLLEYKKFKSEVVSKGFVLGSL